MRSITTSIRWATIGTAAVLAAAGCGGGAGGGPGGPASTTPLGGRPSTATPTPLMWPRPTVDPAVARWAKAWKRRIERPMQRASGRLAASIGPALGGSSSAAFALTPALNALSNCRLPLDLGLADTPADLAGARHRTLRACREIYVGTDRVIAGLNSQSGATADAGMARVRHGIAMLRRVDREVKRAARPR